MKKVKYVFVILVYKNTDDIKDYIKNIKKLNINSEIIIVNSYYDDKSKNIFESIAKSNNCVFINVENKGYGYGNNRGIEYANKAFDYEYIIISNPDIYIKEFNETNLERYNDSVIGPIIKTKCGKNQNPYWYIENKLAEKLIYLGCKNLSKISLYIGIIWNKIIREVGLRKFNISNKRFQKVFAVHGSFLILPKIVLNKIGMPYDEDMFLFAEESHLAHLLKKHNIETYITKDISIIHYEDGSMSVSSINSKEESRKSVIKYYEKLEK